MVLHAGQTAPERSEKYDIIARLNIECLSPCMPERNPDAAGKAPTEDAVRYAVNPYSQQSAEHDGQAGLYPHQAP